MFHSKAWRLQRWCFILKLDTSSVFSDDVSCYGLTLLLQEEIRDLLAKDQARRLELKERPDTGVYVKVRGNAARGNAARGNAARGNAARGNAARGNAARGNAARGNAARDNAARGNAARGNAACGNTARGNTARGNVARGNAARGNAARASFVCLLWGVRPVHEHRNLSAVLGGIGKFFELTVFIFQ